MWKRIVAPVAVVSILWIAVSMVTTYYVGQLLESHSRSIAENVTTIDAAWSMRRDIWRHEVAILEAASQGMPVNAQAGIFALEETFLKSFEEARQTSFTPPEQALINTIRERFEEYRQNTHAWLDAGDHPRASASDRAKSMRLATAVSEPCRELIQLNQQMIDDEVLKNKHLYTTVMLFRTGFLIVGPLVGLAMGLWVTRRLNRSISQISINLKDATGKLGGELGSVAVSMFDELPQLQRQVQIVADRIREVVKELEEAQRRVVQSERLAAVGELAAGVAHEIRNPLTSVKLLIQAASQRQPGPGMSAQQFEILLQEISRMEGTIQGLLDFARPSRPHMVRHDVRQTVRRALNLNMGRAEQHDVKIVEDNWCTPTIVNGDPEQLHQVFANLVINAIEAMSAGGTLRVSIRSDGDFCRITFSDTGAGIPSQILDRVFEPFVTNKERGTGLGLAISRRIVEEHGGSLIASNRLEGGAELTVNLRLVIAGQSDSNGKAIAWDQTSAALAAQYEAANAKIAGH